MLTEPCATILSFSYIREKGAIYFLLYTVNSKQKSIFLYDHVRLILRVFGMNESWSTWMRRNVLNVKNSPCTQVQRFGKYFPYVTFTFSMGIFHFMYRSIWVIFVRTIFINSWYGFTNIECTIIKWERPFQVYFCFSLH